MSNGAPAAAGKRARAAPLSASRDALTRGTTAPSDAGFMELLFDDAMDADGAPEAAQISHSQIIERQAETIARLEASAARAKDYKTLTKVKLKEAAQRLKDYRLRVEALMGEVESAKTETAKLESEKKKALAQVTMLKKKQQAVVAVAAPVMKKPLTKSVAVQTDAKPARSMAVQTETPTREIETQTEAATVQEPTRRIAQPTVVETACRQIVADGEKAAVRAVARETSSAIPKASAPVAKATPTATAIESKPAETARDVPVVDVASVFDAISATIDAELDFSDDDSDDDAAKADAAATVAGATGDVTSAAAKVVLPSLLDDEISREIDAELDFGSSSDDSSSSDDDEDEDEDDGDEGAKNTSQEEIGRVGAEEGGVKPVASEKSVVCAVGEVLSAPVLSNGSIDAISSAIDAELASSSEEEDHTDATLDDLLVTATDPLLVSPRQEHALPVRLNGLVGSPLGATGLPSTLYTPLVVQQTASVDVEMAVMTISPSSNGPMDDISAALDAELATSSSEDEDETPPVVPQPVVEPAPDHSSSAIVSVKATSGDVEMTRPTEPEDVDPIIDSKAPTASDDIEMADEANDIDSSASASLIISSTATVTPVVAEKTLEEKTLEEVLREKSRALSLSSDSDSSDSSSSSSEDEASVESTTNPISVVAASSLSSPVRHAPTPVESLWSVSIAKSSSSAKPVESPVRVVKPRAKREVDGTDKQSEPEPKKQKMVAPLATEQTPVMEKGPVLSVSAEPTKPAIDEESMPEIPAPAKREAAAPSALPPGVWASYKISTAPQEGEDVDVAYVTRTLGILLKQVSSFLTRTVNGIGFKREFYSQVTKHADVIKLCKMLADEYRHRHVTCEVLIEAMTRVLRTPRTRQLVDKSIVVVSVLFRNVLVRLLRLGSSSDPSGAELVSEIHQCLLHLRNLVVAGRSYKGFALPRDTAAESDPLANALEPSLSTKPSAMGHEIAFIAHVSAFHAAICQTIDRSDIARVLLVDVLKCHPTIKGLYCVYAMVQVDPLVLQKRWDRHGNERRSALRAVIIHGLLAIAAQSREKQETILYKETASTLLSVVAEAIDEPLLEPVGYPYGRGSSGPSNESIHEFQATLWRDHIVPCLVGGSSEEDVFDTATALELLGALHGDAMMGRHFSLFKFQNLLTTDRNDQEDGVVNGDVNERSRLADPMAYARIVCFVGALSRGILRSHATDHGSSFFVVDEAVRWMVETVLPEIQDCTGEESATLRNVVVSELIEVLLGMSVEPLDHPKLAQKRDAALHKLLQWLTPDRLAALASSSLRQLRLLVVAARPLTETT